MSESQKTVVCVLTSLMLCAGAKAIGADSAANPYQGIVDRNVFGLKPPPPPPRPEDNKPPAPKITLNGITTILGNKRALMSVQMPARPPEPAKPQSFFLAEGQRDGDIEVLEINEKLDGGTVKVNNFGTVQTLTMDKDGAKLPAAVPAVPFPAAAALVPGVPPSPGGYVPPPAFNPAIAPTGGGLKTIPTRQLRLPTPGGSAAPGGVSPGGVTLPGLKPGPAQPPVLQ